MIIYPTRPDRTGGGINLYQYAPNTLSWIDLWGLSCYVKMQSYKNDVHTKRPHADIL